MPNDDYLSLLDRAKTQLPETIEKHERFVVPEPDVFQEGKTTVFRNFGDVVDALRREPEHVLQYLLRELGTPGTLEGRRVIFKTRLTSAQIADKVQSYVDTFVSARSAGDRTRTSPRRTVCSSLNARPAAPIVPSTSARSRSPPRRGCGRAGCTR